MFESLQILSDIATGIMMIPISVWAIVRGIRYKAPFESIVIWSCGVIIGISEIAYRILNLYQHEYAQIAEFTLIGSGIMFLIFIFILVFRYKDKYGTDKDRKRLKWALAYVIVVAIFTIYILFFY